MRTTAKMELRTAVHVSSSWEVCGDISTVLYVVSSSGCLLDEPLSGGRCPKPISITALTSDPDQPCRLHIDLSDLRGYIASQIELTTSSRTTELYCDDDDEYVGTVRGTVAGTCDTNKGSLRKLYSCDHILPTDSPHQKFNIKLLSLRGRREVLVEMIQLVVTADHGGSAATITPRPAVLGNGMDMQQLLGSLPVGSMPPFMQTLVSSLTHLTTQVGSGEHTAVDGDRADRPPELSQLMDTLRQMRPPPVQVAPSCSNTSSREEVPGENTDRVAENGRVSPEDPSGATGEEGDSTDLERRLKRYIDNKFEELERRLVERLEELLVKQLKTPNSPPCTTARGRESS